MFFLSGDLFCKKNHLAGYSSHIHPKIFTYNPHPSYLIRKSKVPYEESREELSSWVEDASTFFAEGIHTSTGGKNCMQILWGNIETRPIVGDESFSQ